MPATQLSFSVHDDRATALPRTRGHLAFLTESERDEWIHDRARARALIVALDALSPGHRGAFADTVLDAIDATLDAAGAPPPGLHADDPLADRLYRARKLGFEEVCVVLGSLAPIVDAATALAPEDARALVAFCRATEERPFSLLLREGTQRLGCHVEPVPLERVLAGKTTMPREDVRPATPRAVVPAADLARQEAVRAARAAKVSKALPLPIPVVTPAIATVETTEIAAPVLASVPVPVPVPAPAAVNEDAWRIPTSALAQARGPQTLASLEKLFAESYMPLGEELRQGRGDARAREVHDTFRRNFARVYNEACPTFAVTGKRPRMVLDAFDVASRLARLHGARSTHLVLVDSLRWDLGQELRRHVTRELENQAQLCDEHTLWAALPTSTARQLHSLAHGIDALRGPLRDEGEESLRGRTAEVIRRIKLGARDVHKFDYVAARLRESGIHAEDALATIAYGAAQELARHARTLAPRTLLFVFGDHGFTLDDAGRVRSGGATPEEVLVPAFAFVTAEVQ
ncbi:MAG: hypothetical protein U0169_13805 [Polyangiaceae bacterium]